MIYVTNELSVCFPKDNVENIQLHLGRCEILVSYSVSISSVLYINLQTQGWLKWVKIVCNWKIDKERFGHFEPKV